MACFAEESKGDSGGYSHGTWLLARFGKWHNLCIESRENMKKKEDISVSLIPKFLCI